MVALDAGGTRETVVDGETGVLVEEGTPKAFAEALAESDFTSFSADLITRHAERFSRERFVERFTAEVRRLT